MRYPFGNCPGSGPSWQVSWQLQVRVALWWVGRVGTVVVMLLQSSVVQSVAYRELEGGGGGSSGELRRGGPRR